MHEREMCEYSNQGPNKVKFVEMQELLGVKNLEQS